MGKLVYRLYSFISNIPIHDFFHQNTALHQWNLPLLQNHVTKALKNEDFIELCSAGFDDCNKDSALKLVKPRESSSTKSNLFNVMVSRRSVRQFVDKPVSEQDFSDVIYYSFGLTGHYEPTKDKTKLNLYAYPSAGGLNPLRFYIIIHNVENIPNGLYFYCPDCHSLTLIRSDFDYREYKHLTGSLTLVNNCAFSIYIIGDMTLPGYKYGNRGYRFMNLEAGHAAQNVYLATTGLNLGTVSSGGFLDEDFFEYLPINQGNKYVLYELFIGNPDYSKDYRF